MSISQPIIRKIEDNVSALNYFESVSMQQESEKTKEILMSFPTVYIHNWKDTGDYEVYIGESNHVFQRTRQHYDQANADGLSWQQKMKSSHASLYIIGHEHFNKSMTLDVENRLMHYMLSVPKVKKVHNLRGNLQSNYYPIEELDPIFSRIWAGLRRDNEELFPKESSIRDSAIFKASPLHKLTKDQIDAQNQIIERVLHGLWQGQTGQLCLIDGEAGTGKTVLNSSTFYELFCRMEEGTNQNIRCALIVNHEEQITVYEQIAEKLGLTDRYGEVVYRPTRFMKRREFQMRDDMFIRGSLPMTKSEVRAVSLSKLELTGGSVFWDIGAGTGSVAVEAASLLMQMGGAEDSAVYAVEKEAEGICLIRQNRERLVPGFCNFHLVEGRAPEVLEQLPPPSHVFIGGSGGELQRIIALILRKNPKVRIVINTVTIETLTECMELIRKFGFADYEIVQVSVSRMERAGRYHLQKAQNPVYVIALKDSPADGQERA